MCMTLSSRGWRSTSRTWRRNSGSSSRKRIAMMGQRHLARHRHLATPDQPHIRNGMMRGMKRAGRAQHGVGAGVAGDEVEWLWSGGLPLTPPPGR